MGYASGMHVARLSRVIAPAATLISIIQLYFWSHAKASTLSEKLEFWNQISGLEAFDSVLPLTTDN